MAREERAAVRIQAQFRGFRGRRQRRRGVRAVTRLQARQRGRFSRREYAELREFSREQEQFQQATRRRQLRIWRNEQELYFLQHTNAEDLERVREFQQQRAARLLQRTWRSTSSTQQKTEQVIDPRDRIYTFDPFSLASAASKQRFGHWNCRDEAVDESLRCESGLLLENKEIERPSSGADWRLPTASVDDEAFASKRKAIRERIKRLATQEKTKTTSNSKSPTNRRRELYEQLIATQRVTARRLLRYKHESRASRPERDCMAAQLVTSCSNRLKILHTETPEHMTSSSRGDNQLTTEEAGDLMEQWDSTRRSRAWQHHCRAVQPVLEKRQWWQTHLAGQQRDIRRVVVAKSPWEDESKIWSWPRRGNAASGPKQAASSSSSWPSTVIQRFLFCDTNASSISHGEQTKLHPRAASVDDQEASEWWRAHCTQSHLTGIRPSQTEKQRITTVNSTNPDILTPEMVANCELHSLQQRAKRKACSQSIERDVEQRVKALNAQVQRRVHDMEQQIEANTRLIQEVAQRKVERRARITREQQAASTIQRHARGMRGRRQAREQRAEFFVMVRGRAIRRGRCEECGDERAVLECQQCEESVRFCPTCWVHVHSTRRRKNHVAIPMTAVVVPTPVREVDEGLDAPRKVATTKVPSKVRVVKAEATVEPRLRALPSPQAKHSMTREAESVAIDTMHEDEAELEEACALARSVRREVAGAEAADIAQEEEPQDPTLLEMATDSADMSPIPEVEADFAAGMEAVECPGDVEKAKLGDPTPALQEEAAVRMEAADGRLGEDTEGNSPAAGPVVEEPNDAGSEADASA